MKEIKVYISAPITGRDLEERKSYFDKAAQELKDMGFVPVNPMKNGVREAAAHATHMRADLKMLLASSYYVQALDCVCRHGCKYDRSQQIHYCRVGRSVSVCDGKPGDHEEIRRI